MGGQKTGPSHPDGMPVVSTLARAARLLGCSEAELTAAVERSSLEVWGAHADGSPVWQWRALMAAANEAGLPIPPKARAVWRRSMTGKRKTNGFGQELDP
jgi:hypothetical protein